MTGCPSDEASADELARVFAREVGRCTATLIRILGDIDLAQDAVAEAFADRGRAVAGHGAACQPRRLDHHHRPQPSDRSAAS